MFQTGEPTLLDVHCAPMFESLVLMEGSALNRVVERLKLIETAPNMIEYTKKWRKHPLI
jgi:hypothetical protein